jgi:2-polyprenyl-3-methyl-5-hydroxy-6-metoxy-1,4-benzoquinol methylase
MFSLKQPATDNTPPRNPDFDDDRVIWDDAWSGIYKPVPYSQQFDGQWKLYLEQRRGFHNHTGVETTDEYIDDRIYEITNVKDYLLTQHWGALAPIVAILSGRERRKARRAVGTLMYNDIKFSVDFFRGKKCLDIACGAGRWTKTMLSLGGNVTSVDVSEHGLKSTRRFNPNTHEVDLFTIPERPDFIRAFDFVLAWGILMCTHDPKLAFLSAAEAVKPGGAFYFCVYTPPYHASEFVRSARRKYHRELKTPEERVAHLAEITRNDPDNAINYLDMLNTFYNWTILDTTIRDWCASAGFTEPVFLNRNEPHKCQHHVLTWRRG